MFGVEDRRQVGGADHAVDDGDVVGEEDADQRPSFEKCTRACVERGKKCVDGIEGVVSEELSTIGKRIDGWEGGRGCDGRG